MIALSKHFYKRVSTIILFVLLLLFSFLCIKYKSFSNKLISVQSTKFESTRKVGFDGQCVCY